MHAHMHARAPTCTPMHTQNENGDVWALSRLRAELGGAWAGAWGAMQRSAALAVAAALPRALEVCVRVCL